MNHPMQDPDFDLYADGNAPMAGDLIEYGAQGGRMLVSRVLEEAGSSTKLWVGAHDYSPHLAVLISRYGEPDIDTITAELKKVRTELKLARDLIVGWREYDWPEGFDRRTAQMIADRLETRTTS